MRSRNAKLVLSFMLVLCAALLVGHLSGSTLGTRVAEAAPPEGPNASVQRQRMIAEIQKLNTSISQMNQDLNKTMQTQRRLMQLLERGNARVTVTNLDEINSNSRSRNRTTRGR